MCGVTCLINILLPTIRFSAVAKDVMTQILRAGEENGDVHVSIADGQEDEDKKRWILASADSLSKEGRFTYIGLVDPTERLCRAAQIETEWVLLVADDDLFSINYLRCALDAARTAAPAVTAFVPSIYLSYSSKGHLPYRLQPVNEPDQLGRLTSLFTQGHNGLLTFGVMRRRWFQEWMDFVRTKSLWPTYSDQLLVSYLAMKGRLLPLTEECVILKDDSDWHDPRRAILKDSGSYPERVLTLFHEVFWAADLFTFLQAHGLEEEAIPAVMGRVNTLLRNGAGNLPLRLHVLGIPSSVSVQEASELVEELSTHASVMVAEPIEKQREFLKLLETMSQSLRVKFGLEPSCASLEEFQTVTAVSSGGFREGCRQEAAPAVSVIVPCYNQAEFLAEAVESVVAQTYGDWECLIVDDGSPDQTAQVAHELIARYADKRIRLIRKANGGLSDARNAGIREARGRYILPLDADDRLDPQYLATTVPILENDPDIAIVYVDERTFGSVDSVNRKGVVTLGNLLAGNVHDYCSLYRRSVWEQVGGYSPAMYLGAEDWCFWIGAAKRGLRSFHVKQPLFWYRKRRGTMVEQVYANVEMIKAQIVLHHPELFTELGKEKARLILSSPGEDVCERLKKAHALHPDNDLLRVFRQLAEDDKGKGQLLAGTGSEGWESEREARWVALAAFLERILRETSHLDHVASLRILDVGCDSGWVTARASMYGCCDGVDTDPLVIADARRQFPHLRFETCDFSSLAQRFKAGSYDVVLCSRVLEQMSTDERSHVLEQLASLLKPDGSLILTTRRSEAWEQGSAAGLALSKVQSWMTEKQVAELMTDHGFALIETEELYVKIATCRYIPAPTPADLKAGDLIPLDRVGLFRLKRSQRPSSLLKRPTVSVILPTHNRPQRLREAIKSVLAQRFQDFEIIVVNDGAVDVRSVIDELNDGRITLITHDRNRGLAAARNTGLRLARGKYIAYLDDDDRYLPDHLETLVGVLEQGCSQAAYSDAWRVHEKREGEHYREAGRDVPYSYDFSLPKLLVSNYFPVLCVMHRRSCLDEVGVFDESLFAHEDWDLWIRMATRFPFVHVKKLTAEFTWRTDGSSMTSHDREIYNRTTDIIYRKYKPLAEQFPEVLAFQEQRLVELQKQWEAHRVVCSIIIPVHNNRPLTEQCLTALASATPELPYEVVVVDNGSTDGTPEFLRRLGGDVQIIRNEDNRGFSKACNQGARVAKGRYLVFLNNDTIPQQNWLAPLVQEVEEHPEVGVVGSKLLYPDGTIQHAGVVFSREEGLPYHIYQRWPADAPAVNKRREVQAVSAACVLIRRDLFNAVGGFDETFVNGFEDVDLCLKVRERGKQVIYQPRSVLYHLESQTPGRHANDSDDFRCLRERWKDHWWLADQDLHYYTDGYKVVQKQGEGGIGWYVVPLAGHLDRAAWAHVAAAQRAALNHDWAAVRREISLVNEWPADASVLLWAAEVASHVGEKAYHFALLERAVELAESPVGRVLLARAALEEKNPAQADLHLARLLGADPRHAEGLLLRGILEMQREQYREAETSFALALKEGADRRKCLMGMGMAALGRSYAQGAWERFCEILADHPDDPEAIHWLLRAGTAQNRWEELSRHLKSYVKRNPGDLATRFALSGVLLRADRIEEARQEQEAIRALDPAYDGLAELEQAISKKEAVLAVEAMEG